MDVVRTLACAVVTACLGSLSLEAAAPVVAGFERYGRPADDDGKRIESGLLLLGELSCVNCHAASPEAAAHLMSKLGPVLDNVGTRLRPSWIVRYLKDPHATKPGTTMPHMLAGLSAAEQEKAATALAHFLIGTGEFAEGWGTPRPFVRPQEGLTVYEQSGCAACHGTRKGGATPLPDSVPLGDLDGKWSPASLDEFLKNPLVTRPSSRMPAIQLADDDRRQLVAALLPTQAAYRSPFDDVTAFNGRAWPARMVTLGDMATLGAPSRSGPVIGFGVAAIAPTRDHFAVQLDGFFHAAVSGTYAFHLASDDGSRLFIGTTMVVDNDGPHPMREMNGKAMLTAGVHPLRVEYFEAVGDESLAVDVTPPGGKRRSVLAHTTSTADATPAHTTRNAETELADFVVNPVLAAEGQRLFAEVGCANCHAVSDSKGQGIVAHSRHKPLNELSSLSAGCLIRTSAEPAGNEPVSPRYRLDEPQMAAIQAAIAWLKTPSATQAPMREQRIDRSFTALNCYACHVRDGKGGAVPAVAMVDDDGEPIRVEPARDAVFTAAVADLGEEGRLPPSLTGAGDKHNPAFLSQVLREGGHDRVAYMHTRMPKWAAAVSEPLAKLLADDPKTSVSVPTLEGFVAAEVAEQGRKLCGSAGVGCIKCHAFDGQKGQSLGVIDMARMPARLRHEWFLAYVANPQQFRRGTRMPAAWPDGKTFFTDILDGTAAGQIEAVWRYVSIRNPPVPVGLANNPIELVPDGRPIVYRNFIEGVSVRAIAVGYPERVSIAWDANAPRLALVWKNGFIDASRHWTGMGSGFQPPLGDGVFTADPTVPLAMFATAADLTSAQWPAGAARGALGPVAGHAFQGYRLDALGRPAFRWRWGDCSVAEALEPTSFSTGDGKASQIGLRRTLTISAPSISGVAVFRAAAGERITPESDGWHEVDGRWRVRIVGGQPVIHRGDGGRLELRVPLVWKPRGDGHAEAVIVEELSW